MTENTENPEKSRYDINLTDEMSVEYYKKQIIDLRARIDDQRTLASVRRADSGGDISISGNKKIKSLEKEFDTVFGRYAQVCYTNAEGHRYYTSGSNDEKLSQLSMLNVRKMDARRINTGN